MTPRLVTINGKDERWLVDFGVVEGKRRRRYYKSKGEAQTAIRTFEQERKAAGQKWAQIAPERRVEIVEILGRAKRAGASLEDLWAHWQATKQARSGLTLGAVVDEFLTVKERSGVSPQYLEQLQIALRQFCLDRADVDLAELTPRVVEDYLAGLKLKPSTQQTALNRLSSFFSFCVRRDYIDRNPCARVERVRVPQKDPEILTVEDCQQLVTTAQRIDKGALTYLGLALFCGIRPDEVLRIDRAEINLERGLVFLSAEKSKVRNRRIVDLTAPAKRCIEAGEDLPKVNFRRRLERVRKEAGIKYWPHDALRKTAASHFYNLYGIDKAVEQLGHSATVLLRVYRELVSKEETERWLAIGFD